MQRLYIFVYSLFFGLGEVFIGLCVIGDSL